MNVIDLLQWWNLIFVLPFVVALGYILLLGTGSVSAEFGVHELEADIEPELDTEIVPESHWDLHDTPDAGFWSNALTLLGVGRAPLSIIITCFCFSWGFFGWASNEVFRSILPAPLLFIWPSVGVAALSAFLLTRFTVQGITKFLPLDQSFAVTNQQLVGRRAKARFTITASSGTAQLNDQYGTLHEISCRIKEGAGEMQKTLAPGTMVILLEYDHTRKLFYVRADPLENQLEKIEE